MSQISNIPDAKFELPYHPDDAISAKGKFFRLTAGNLKVDDTVPAKDWILPINKKRGECSVAGSESRRECYSHSIYSDLEDMTMIQQTVPWARKKSIASVEVMNGYVKATPRNGNSHHSWWPEPLSYLPTAICIAEKP